MEEFRALEKEAREAGRGLWAAGGLSAEPSRPAADGSPGGCRIKGNINAKGQKIYHLPGMRFYDKTRIDESRGERWFCSEEEAIKAGWRKAR
jgi:hypothetical protein